VWVLSRQRRVLIIRNVIRRTHDDDDVLFLRQKQGGDGRILWEIVGGRWARSCPPLCVPSIFDAPALSRLAAISRLARPAYAWHPAAAGGKSAFV
jgi:hypothetical protein